jgi:hypothetical protein
MRKKVGSVPENRVRRTDVTAAEQRKNPNGTLKRGVAGQKLAFFNGLLNTQPKKPAKARKARIAHQSAARSIEYDPVTLIET